MRVIKHMKHKRLPLLDYASSLFEVDLSSSLAIICHHILESNFTLSGYLFDKGLKPKNTFLLGKAYSTNQEILKGYKKIGVNVYPASSSYNSHKSFDEQFESAVKNFLNEISKSVNFSKYDKILILDDGGNVLFHANKIFKDVKKIIGVEQTTSGYEKLKNKNLRFPVVNVARSKAKLELESPMIVGSVLGRLNRHLKNLKLKPRKVLILGIGPIGKNFYEELSKKWEVYRYDEIRHKSDFDKASLRDILKEFDLILGCTGKQIITPSLYKHLKKGVVLASASSSDGEFSSINLRKLVNKNNDPHKNIIVNNISLLNSGFPLNFDGSKKNVSLQKIQLTLSLVFSAVCLGKLNRYPNGIIDLDTDVQNKLIKKYKEIS